MTETNDDILLKFLQKGKIITTRNAPELLGIADVRANIRNLRNKGYNIKDKWSIKENRRGRKIRFKQYFLGE